MHMFIYIFYLFCLLLILGCDAKKYHESRDKLEETHRQRVQELVQQWQQAEKRYKLLKTSDEDQAASSVESECLIGKLELKECLVTYLNTLKVIKKAWLHMIFSSHSLCVGKS